MRIEKVINNNVVCSRDEKGIEIVIMGKGIGFRAKAGAVIDERKIEKIFHIKNPATVNQFTELLEDGDGELRQRVAQKYPQEYQCGQKIADYISSTYHTPISEEEVLYLAVHILRVTRVVNDEEQV